MINSCDLSHPTSGEHLTEDFSVDQMAQDLFLSRSYLVNQIQKRNRYDLLHSIFKNKKSKKRSLC